MDITGIILAGGKSSRMGSEKGLVELAGRPLISYAVEALESLCSRIIISSGSDAYGKFGLEVVPDEIPGIGPMGGIYTALKHSRTDRNLVLSCDLPFVTNRLMEYILQSSAGCDVAVPWHGGEHYEPLCGFYHRHVLGMMEQFVTEGNFKLPDLYRKVNIKRLEISEQHPFYTQHLFMNVNTEQELAQAALVMQAANPGLHP